MTIAVANTLLTNSYEFWRNRTNDLAFAMSTYAVTTQSNAAVGDAAITGTFGANAFSGNTVTTVVLTTNTATINALTATSLTTNTATVNIATITTVQANVIQINGSNLQINSTSAWWGNSTVNTNVNYATLTLANSTVTLQISLPTAAQVANGQFYLNANGGWSGVPPIPVTTNTFTTTGTTNQVVDSYLMSSYVAAEYIVNVKDNNANNRFSAKLMTMHDSTLAYVTEYSSITTNSAVGVFSVASNATHVLLSFQPTSTNTTIKWTRTTT